MRNFIKQIKIEQVRHLRGFQIDISDDKLKHLILTGKNGSGKTTLLERIKGYLEVIPDDNLINLVSEWPKHLKRSQEWYIELLNTPNKNLDQQAQMENHKRNLETFQEGIKKYANGLQLVFNEYNDILEKYAKGEYILAYFNATRNVKIDIPTNVPKLELKDKYSMEENIEKVFLNYLVYLKTQQSFARNENDMDEVNKIQIWFDNFEKALKTLFEDNSIYLKFDYKDLNFTINQEGREPYGFDALSDGYSAVLDILINLILRMEKRHTNSYDIEGIVIIDELENHLHIGLQKNILPFLTKFFPNIQFIVSTHSPFIINSIDNAVIYDLEKKQRVEDLSGIAYEGIVEGYFNINQYSEKIKKKLKRYEDLVKKEDKSDNEVEEEYELRRYLKGISSELAPEVTLTFNKIELSRKSKSKNNN